MKKIKEYVDGIDEEICGAKDYIEKALWYKAQGNTIRYNKYKEMAIQELGHADALHTYAVEDIAKLQEVYPDVPADMMDKWNNSHKEYVERVAWIKQMLSM